MKDVDLMISILKLISEAEKAFDESDNRRKRFSCLFTEHDLETGCRPCDAITTDKRCHFIKCPFKLVYGEQE
jgi:hypothetical protein